MSYAEALGQRDRAMEELERRSLQLGERERDGGYVRDRLARVERELEEGVRERDRLRGELERARNELGDRFRSEYEIRLGEVRVEYEREIAQSVARALEAERNTQDEKYKLEISRYVEKLRVCDN